MERWLIILGFFILQITGSVWAQQEIIVKKNETISGLLKAHELNPIYGKNGSLQQTLKLNPNLKKRPNLIFVGEKIVLPISTIESSFELAEQIEEPPIEKNETVKIQKDELKRSSKFSIRLGQSYFRVDGNKEVGTKGIIGSSASPLIEGVWIPQVGEKTFTELGVRLTSVTITQDSKKTIQSRSQTLNKVFLGLNYLQGSRFEFGGQFSFNEQLFFINQSAVNKVEKMGVPSILASAKINLYQFKNTLLSTRAGLKGILPFKNDSINVKSGNGFDLSMIITEKMEAYDLFGELLFSYNKYKSTPDNFESRELTLILGVNI